MSTKNLNSMMNEGNDGDDKRNHKTTPTCTAGSSACNNSSSINNDLAFDGMWSFAGFNGMMVQLAEDFVKAQHAKKAQQKTTSSSGKQDDKDDDDEENYIYFNNFDPSNQESMIECQEKLNERNLHLADGVLRRLVEGCCPSKIPICRLDEETTMKRMVEYKLKGNHHFTRHEFREAIDHYDDALSCIPNNNNNNNNNYLFIAPIHQIQQIVNVLSNKAECLLRKGKCEDAAETTTEALIFMNDHEKSRIRRAKANIEIGKYDRYEITSRGSSEMDGAAYLIQAKYDLEEVLDIDADDSSEGKETAEKLSSKVNRLLKNAKKKVLDKNPTMNANEWDLNVLKIQSRCW
jgi:tetratricopeptide (TPR) repeat protein